MQGTIQNFDKNFQEFLKLNPEIKGYNSLIFFDEPEWDKKKGLKYEWITLWLFKADETTRTSYVGNFGGDSEKFYFRNIIVKNKAPNHAFIRLATRFNLNKLVVEKVIYNHFISGTTQNFEIIPDSGANNVPQCRFTSICFDNNKNFKSSYGKYPWVTDAINLIRRHLGIVKYCDGKLLDDPYFNGKPTTPQQPDIEEQGDAPSCSTTGQFGGGGIPLKDIKLFLYANKVTKGAIKLSKPQVEVGTYATDWRPNPADATKSIEMMLKQIESERKGGRKNGKKRD